MRRRERPSEPPPSRLLAFDSAEWLGLVDPDGYDPDHYRNRREWQSYGPVRLSFEAWREREARSAWVRARVAWARSHGWPGGLTGVDLLRLEVQQRREEHLQGRPDRVAERHARLRGGAV